MRITSTYPSHTEMDSKRLAIVTEEEIFPMVNGLNGCSEQLPLFLGKPKEQKE